MTHAIQEPVILQVTPVDAGEVSDQPAVLRGDRAHLEANASRDRYLYSRHGNARRDVPDGPAMRSMWRRAPLP